MLEDLGGLIQALTDAETAQRGYAITGQEPYLEPYRASLPVIDDKLKDVEVFETSDNPHQQQRLDVLEPMVAQRLASLKRRGLTCNNPRGSRPRGNGS